MANQKEGKNKMDIGIIGLGTMGRNLLLNVADHGYSGAGYDKSKSAVKTFNDEVADRPLQGTTELAAFVDLLDTPRTVLLLVPAGPVVDAVLDDLVPRLDAGDIVIDGGNSQFQDTERRQQRLADKGIHLLGMGISGGEVGARRGPSIMPGGAEEAYQAVQPILTAVAAHVDGDPCVAYLGPRGAGHYVKMVHNGIEYGLMQLIAESYHLLKEVVGLNDAQLHKLFDEWNSGKLNGYLMEISADIFAQQDKETGRPLIDLILAEAEQLGTGRWTAQDAMDLQVPVPTIAAAVSARNISGYLEERRDASHLFTGPITPAPESRFVEQLHQALYIGMIITYAQGFSQLRRASQKYDYGLDLATIARIWRGGCIIRSALLEDFRQAYADQPDLRNLLLNEALAASVMADSADLRTVVATAASAGIPVPAFSATLAYFDSYRSKWLPANLIQAQRDYFGAHTYRRVDEEGVFHTEWGETE